MNRTITQLVILARTFADELEAILQSTASPEAVASPEAPPASAPKKRGRPAAAATPAPADPPQEPATPEPPAPAEGKTLDELKALIAPAVQAGAGAQVKELIKKHGGSQLADLPPENHAAFSTDVEGLVY